VIVVKQNADMDPDRVNRPPDLAFWPYDFDELGRTMAALDGLNADVGAINPRPRGWYNDFIQIGKRVLARLFAWYTRPVRRFNAAVARSLQEIVPALDHASMNMTAIDHLSINMAALEARLAQSEKTNAMLRESIQEQLALLSHQIQASGVLPQGTNLGVPGTAIESNLSKGARDDSRLFIDTGLGTEKTIYIMGLFGTGRLYVNDLILQHIGPRAKYFRDTIRLHPGPTPMIYSGHATNKYVSYGQARPELTSRITEAVRSGFADSIFVYRHPFDSLLTNWIWWRTFIRENRQISGISQLYKEIDHLCADLDTNFPEFQSFAEGDPKFFAAVHPRFLSFDEFVEETYLHLQSASLTLRLEDFMIDPLVEFTKVAGIMSVDLDLRGVFVRRPQTKAYGYVEVKKRVPKFKSFINGLSAVTKQRIERIGYNSAT
jgi:hypothetical protein